MIRKTVDILNVKVDKITSKEAAANLALLMEQKKPSLLATPNSEFIIKAQNDEEFREILNTKTKFNLADSFGVLWAATFLSWHNPSQPVLREVIIISEWLFSILAIPIFPGLFHNVVSERVPGVDFIWEIAKFAAEKNLRLYLLGGAPTVAERAALKLQTDVFGLRVVGVNSGTPEESAKIVESINKSRADILIVCFGAPKQEKWLAEYLSKTCCKIGIGLGGTFDFIAQIKPRAPIWMRKTGLEWLYRLVVEPSRIGRQLAIPKLMWLVLIEKLKNRPQIGNKTK